MFPFPFDFADEAARGVGLAVVLLRPRRGVVGMAIGGL